MSQLATARSHPHTSALEQSKSVIPRNDSTLALMESRLFKSKIRFNNFFMAFAAIQVHLSLALSANYNRQQFMGIALAMRREKQKKLDKYSCGKFIISKPVRIACTGQQAYTERRWNKSSSRNLHWHSTNMVNQAQHCMELGSSPPYISVAWYVDWIRSKQFNLYENKTRFFVDEHRFVDARIGGSNGGRTLT